MLAREDKGTARLIELYETKGTGNSTATLFDQTYTYNGDGTKHSSHEVQTQTNGTSLTLDTTWTYDADGRLSGEHVDALRDGVADPSLTYTDAFGFDLNNNRVARTHTPGGGTPQITVYRFNGDDQLVDEGPDADLNGLPDNGVSTHYAYDDNGSQLLVDRPTGPDDTYAYDLRNKMTSATVDNTDSTYVYDDHGNRVQQTTNGVTSKYLTDGNNPSGYAQPIERRTNASTAPATTYLAGDRVFAQTDNADTAAPIYLLLDGHGSTQQVTSAAGSIVQAIQYDAFGSGINGSPLVPTHTVYLFGGDAIYDPASGLYLHGDGTRGRSDFRFIQDDDHQYGSNANPISLNLSLYAGGNTISNFDVSGHDLISTLVTIGTKAFTFANFAVLSYTTFNAAYRLGTVFNDLIIEDKISIEEAFEEVRDVAGDVSLDLLLSYIGGRAFTGAMATVFRKLGAGKLLRLTDVIRTNGRLAELAVSQKYLMFRNTAVRIGRYLPDFVDSSVIREVKNVAELVWSPQISAFASEAIASSRRFFVHVRPSTEISPKFITEMTSRFGPGSRGKLWDVITDVAEELSVK